MRDVLGFSGAEVADALAMTPVAVYSALQRAHKTVDERLPERSRQATLRSLGDVGLREIVGGFVDAWARADVETLAVLALTSEPIAEITVFRDPPPLTRFGLPERIEP